MKATDSIHTQIKSSKTASAGLMTLSDSALSGAAEEYREAGYSFASHMHTSIEIYRILSGECYMDIQTESLHCTAGDFVMVLPDVIHSFYLKEDSDCTFSHFHFNPSMFSDIILENDGIYPVTLMQAIYFSSQFFYHMKTDATIDTYLQKLLELYHSSNSLFSSANINVALMNLMLHILNHAQPIRNGSSSHLQNSYVAYTLNYIQKNYTSKIKQEDIAQQLHISVRYLSKLFKEYMGVPLSSYINIYRVNRSIELMQHTDMTLTEIALLVGFKDSQRFSKVFMSVINSSPSHYRKTL